MTRARRLAVTFAALIAFCGTVYWSSWGRPSPGARPATSTPRPTPTVSALPPDDRPAPPGLQKVTLAAGCFWCTESAFDGLRGVVATTSGYTGGRLENPTYTQVSAGGTGHVEAVEITFDPTLITVDDLLEHYWRNVDLFNEHGQFCDYGEQYRPVVFVHGAEQRRVADGSKARVQERFGRRVAVDIVEASAFYAAESWHQDYSRKNPLRYQSYLWGCGRAARLADIWRQPS